MPAARTAIHLIGGSDEFTIKERAAAKAAELTPPGSGEFGVEIIEGAAANQDEALKVLGRLREALQTVGFFSAAKLVWWKNTNLLADDRAVTAEAVKDALADLAEEFKRGLPDGVTLLISALGCDQRRTLFQTIKKLGAVELHDAPEAGKRDGEEQIGEFIREKLAAEGKRFGRDALGAFRELVEPSLREIANELEKVCLYVGPRPEITVADVRAICSASRQAVIWELVDAVGARHLPKAIRAVENLLDQGEAAIGVVMMLAGQFRLTLLAKDLAQRKVLVPGAQGFDYVKSFERLPEEEKAHFPRSKDGGLPNAWRLYRCALAARNFTSAELVRAMDLLLEAHLQLVSTQLDDRLVLEETLTKITRRVTAAPVPAA